MIRLKPSCLHPRGQAPKSFASGQAAIAAVIFFFSVSIVIGGSVAASALRQTAGSRMAKKSLQSFSAAESGVEDAIYRLKTGKQIGSQTALAVGGAVASTVISAIPDGQQIIASGQTGETKRKVRAKVSNVIGVSFVYGAQVGYGGLVMSNNSRVEGEDGAVGNVSVLGDIIGGTGAVITGSAITTSTLNGVTVYGDARARNIGAGAKICGDAYFQSISSTALDFLNSPASPCPLPRTAGTAHPGQPPATAGEFPITDAMVQDWKEEAGCGAVPAVAPCLYAGNYTVSSDSALGPKTITGNLTINNNRTLIVTGAIRVQGNITLNNGSDMRCSSIYGAKSCMVFADGWVDLNNGAVFAGSGSAGSYIMLLSTAACDGTASTTAPCDTAPSNAAVELANNAEGALIYATRGMVYMSNNAEVTNVTGFKLKLNNNAVVQYEQGITDVKFSTGPSGSWGVTDWREIE